MSCDHHWYVTSHYMDVHGTHIVIRCKHCGVYQAEFYSRQMLEHPDPADRFPGMRRRLEERGE